MSYIGRNVDKISNIEILDNITFDGSSSYSITKSSVAFTPNSAQSLLISIDGVVQATNFTVSGSTIDFGVAIPSTSTCDFFLHYGTGVLFTPADGTVTEAKIGSGAVTSAKLGSDVTQGITMADQWRLTTSFNFTSSGSDVTSNLSRVDTTGQGTLGTGMTESSGIFSFPSTGIYKVEATLSFYANGNSPTWVYNLIKATTDNSNYTDLAGVYHGQTGTGHYWSSHNSTLVDVTDTSNVKVKFHVDTQAGTIQLYAQSTINSTFFTFTRLGDT